jgi:DNA-binding IclR family transcriptional regulator
MSEQSREDGGVSSTETLVDIVEVLSERDGAGVTEIADALGLAKSTVYGHLQTLRQREYVLKEGDTYQLTLRFLDLGQSVRTRRTAYELAREKVEKVADETDERCQFIVEEHGHGVYMFREIGDDAVRTDSAIGKHIPLHATAAGKAILATMPRDRVEAIVDEQGLEALTDRTITDRDELFAELETTRERGYAINHGENTAGLYAVGVSVADRDGEVLGALSVSGPAERMTDDRRERELPELMLGVANELELNIAYA